MRKVLVIEYLNNEFKQKYIKEKSTISENFTRNIFNKADDLEKFYNKDICNFTLSEIKNSVAESSNQKNQRAQRQIN